WLLKGGEDGRPFGRQSNFYATSRPPVGHASLNRPCPAAPRHSRPGSKRHAVRGPDLEVHHPAARPLARPARRPSARMSVATRFPVQTGSIIGAARGVLTKWRRRECRRRAKLLGGLLK